MGTLAGALSVACAAQHSPQHAPRPGVAGFESTTFGTSNPNADAAAPLSACLHAPLDLTLDPGTAPASEWVDDIRLGYSNLRGVYLSRPLCQIHGAALCRFVEAHEQAHHYTKTIGRSSECAETLADCWAGQHADVEAVQAAVDYFSVRHGSDDVHAEPRDRARIISQCAADGARSGSRRVSAAKSKPNRG